MLVFGEGFSSGWLTHFYANRLMRSVLFPVNHLLALTQWPKIEPCEVWAPQICLNLVRAICFRLADPLLCRFPDTKRAPLGQLIVVVDNEEVVDSDSDF